MTIRAELTRHVQAAVVALYREAGRSEVAPTIALTQPREAAHGDFACSCALALAKVFQQPPRALASRLQLLLGDAAGLLAHVEVAGAGYLNLTVREAAWRAQLATICELGGAFVDSAAAAPQRILLEYVSANPTGPLHVAHGRSAVLGDVLAGLLKTAGHQVEREYYVNDLGQQADVMARSIHWRYAELCGRSLPQPNAFYPGDYLLPIAAEVRADVGEAYLDAPESQWLTPLRSLGIARMLVRIRADLVAFGIAFDQFVSERSITEAAGLAAMLARLEVAGHIYRQDDKLWFRATAFGDDKDRVVVRDDGRPTYFASDIAYHADKMQRGFDRLINIWGADHGGYIARVRAGLEALGHPGDALHVILVQMVSLSRGGEAVKMGKRLGTAVWLQDVIDEAGRDATRYFFLMKRADTQMDFDVDLATQRSLDNPVYYAQMGHARLAAIGRRAREAGHPAPKLGPGALEPLQLPEELGLIRALSRAPEVVAAAAAALEPHQVITYVQELIAQFHSYYSQYRQTQRVISDSVEHTRARLLLCSALQAVLKKLLDLLGVEAPERMMLPVTLDAEIDAS